MNLRPLFLACTCMVLCMSLCAKSPQNSNQPEGDPIPVVNESKPDDAKESVQLIDKLPEFPGGQVALFKFIEDNLQYPETAYKDKIEGKAICQFVVDTDGSLTDIKVLRSSGHPLLDLEAVRVINSMPRWNPAIQKGKPARTNYTVPITFQLSGVDRATKVNEDLRPSNKSAFKWRTGDSILVKREDSNMLLTPDNEIASLNVGYYMANDGKIRGRITVIDDAMTVDYYEGDSHTKKETYKVKKNGEILLEGNQYYYLNDRLLCIDLIRKGVLLGSTWFDADGNKDRSFVYSQAGVAVQTQYYPSGEKMCVKDYMRETVTSFDQSGNEATFEPCSLSEDFNRFTVFFNQAFRCNKFYTHEPFFACVTIGSDGRCSAWVYNMTSNQIIPLNCAQAPQWQPAKINGQPVSSTVFRTVEYNPMEYATCHDTLPMNIMKSEYTTYSGRKWINTPRYFVVPVDACSSHGTICKSGDTTILTCYNKVTGERICMQRSLKNHAGKRILQGWSTYYANGKKSYEELAVNDTVVRTIHYSEEETPQMAFVLGPTNIAAWDTMWAYYPTGELKSLSVLQDKTDKQITTYFDKQGQPTTDVVLPTYSGSVKALNKYLKQNVPIRQSKLYTNKSWTSLDCWADIYVDIDETGKIVHAGKGASSCKQSFKTFALSRWDIDELYDLILDCIRQDPTPWTPGTINGEPAILSTMIRVKYACTNK